MRDEKREMNKRETKFFNRKIVGKKLTDEKMSRYFCDHVDQMFINNSGARGRRETT